MFSKTLARFYTIEDSENKAQPRLIFYLKQRKREVNTNKHFKQIVEFIDSTKSDGWWVGEFVLAGLM